MLVRVPTLAERMSRYLIRCLEVLPNVTVRTRTQIVAVEGSERHLERVRWRNEAAGEEETRGDDVRAGSVKRIGVAVGEGAACVQLVHRVMQEWARRAQRNTSLSDRSGHAKHDLADDVSRGEALVRLGRLFER